jgi:hypothetical protein
MISSPMKLWNLIKLLRTKLNCLSFIYGNSLCTKLFRVLSLVSLPKLPNLQSTLTSLFGNLQYIFVFCILLFYFIFCLIPKMPSNSLWCFFFFLAQMKENSLQRSDSNLEQAPRPTKGFFSF